MKYNKVDIEYLLYDSYLDLNKIIDIKKNLNENNITSEDRDYLEELLNDELDVIDELDELKKIKQIFIKERFDVSYIDRLIKRKEPISIDELDLLDKEDLEYYIYDGSLMLDLDGLLRVKFNTSKYEFSDFDLETLEDCINENIEGIKDIKKLEEYKQIMKDYNFNTDFISRIIYNKKHGIIEESSDPLINYLDNYISFMPREVLNKVREDDIANNEDTEIIDKAMIIKEKRENKYDKSIKVNEKKQRKEHSNGLLGSLLKGFFISFLFDSKKDKQQNNNNDDLEDWQNDLVNEGRYDSCNFEEEELEDDDYHYDDLD